MAWIQTYSGKQFNPEYPTLESITIRDIAWSLSQQCRYTGHTTRFYSVAEHSVYVSHYVPLEYAITALMHDSSEAYLADIARPVKSLLPEYEKLERVIMGAVAAKFNLVYPFPTCVKDIDDQILMNERRDVMTDYGYDWGIDLEPIGGLIILGLSPLLAYSIFMDRYEELTHTKQG